MNNDNEHVLSEAEGLVPKYRFPEFLDDGSWKNRNLGDISNVVRGGSPRPIEDFLTNEINGLNWLKIADVSPDSKYITSTKERVINEAATKTRIVNKGDLILSNSMSFGRPYILDITTCIHDGWIAISDIKKLEIDKDYLYYLISSDYSQKYFNIYAAGAAVKNLNAEIIKKLPIDYPNNITEQQKIAACLSSLDDVIAGHEEKLTTLEEHKKGLMQNLFPQEGAIKPKYRFPEFQNDGDWVEKKLGDVATFLNGRAYKQEELLDKGKYRVLRVGNFFTNKQWYYSDLELEDNKYCDRGDLLYAWSASFGPKLWTGEKVIYHYHIWKVLPKDKISTLFLYYLLDLETLHMKSRSLNGFALMHITKGAIENWDSIVPINPNEQQKIASVLSSVDELIVAQREKIEALKEHKKGLMQGLFPKIES